MAGQCPRVRSSQKLCCQRPTLQRDMAGTSEQAVHQHELADVPTGGFDGTFIDPGHAVGERHVWCEFRREVESCVLQCAYECVVERVEANQPLSTSKHQRSGP